MEDTQMMRKLDPTGRLVIPSALREKLNLTVGLEYTFFTHDENGKHYLCIECPDAESDLEKAFRVLKENGYKVAEKED